MTTSIHKAGENPGGRSLWENYQAVKSYHLGVSVRTRIAAGFAAGFSNLRLNRCKLFFEVPVDPEVFSSSN